MLASMVNHGLLQTASVEPYEQTTAGHAYQHTTTRYIYTAATVEL